MRGAMMRGLSSIDYYPIVIRQARYSGVYEGGKWLAFPNAEDGVPNAVFGDDEECASFFRSSRCSRVGRGDTPDKALADMLMRQVVNPSSSHTAFSLYPRVLDAALACTSETDETIATLLNDILTYFDERL